ncbi:hypothetical protein [Pelagibius sp.]|uniref:hypothetical protein n=1 Tax=Pelagibius sp. TaxID=1931238 RepID=UPI002616EB0D|nr:hypothetical protein [Pelagibius sp.]
MLQTQNNELLSRVQSLEQSVEENQATAAEEIASSLEAVEKADAELANVEGLLEQLTAKHTETTEQLAAANAEIERLNADSMRGDSSKPSQELRMALDRAHEKAVTHEEEASRAKSRLALAKVENDRLRAQLNEMRSALQAPAAGPATDKEPHQEPKIPKASREAQQVIDASKAMSWRSVAGFLRDAIPRIQGGITCWELTAMLWAERSYLSYNQMNDVHVIVADAAPYVKRPLDDGCVVRLAAKMSPSKVDKGIGALLRAEPKTSSTPP